jgi:hypothetical protein
VILQEEFSTLYTTIEESLEDIIAKYEAFIKISLCNGHHYQHQHETSSANK